MSDLFEQAVLAVLQKYGVATGYMPDAQQAAPNGAPVQSVAPTGTAQANQPADPWANQAAPQNGAQQFAGPQPVSNPAGYQPVAAAAPVAAPQMAAAPQGRALKQFAPPAPGQYQGNGRYGPQTISIGVPNAPVCEHGLPAAYVVGKKQNGQDFTVYRCSAVALPGDGWKNKCQFSQYVNNR